MVYKKVKPQFPGALRIQQQPIYSNLIQHFFNQLCDQFPIGFS
jgi:hypothetical protein